MYKAKNLILVVVITILFMLPVAFSFAAEQSVFGKATDQLEAKIRWLTSELRRLRGQVKEAVPETPVQTTIVQPTQVQPSAQPVMEEEEKDRRDIVDPRELKDVLRQIRDLKAEIKRIVRQAKKNAPNDVEPLNNISIQADKFAANLKNPPTDITQREALQDFYDARLWEEINAIRARTELPQQIKDIERELKRAEKLLKNKSFQKIGVDLSTIEGFVKEIRGYLEEAKTKLATGEYEEAQEALEPIHQGSHPGEVMCVLNGLRDFSQNIRQIKNQEIKAQLQEIFDSIMESVKDGEFRETCRDLNDIRGEAMRIMELSFKSGKANQSELMKKLQKLGDMMIQDFSSESATKEMKEIEKSQ